MIDLSPALAGRQYERLEPWTHAEAANGYVLANRCAARAAAFRDVLLVTEIFDNRSGWARLAHLDALPDEALPWIACVIGEYLLPGTPADQRRQLLAHGGAKDRSTVRGIQRAVASHLDVAADVDAVSRVMVTPRYQGAFFRLLVQTYTSETPDPAAAELAAKRAAPSAWRVIFETLDGWTIGQLEAAYDGQTIGDLEGDFSDLAELESEEP